MRAALFVMVAVGASPCFATELNFNKPTLIDAAAVVLFSSARQEDFDRVDDNTVRVNITGSFDRELRRMPSKPCAVQLVDLATGPRVYGQFDFSRLSGDYITYPLDSQVVPGTRFRLLGSNMYCDRTGGRVGCRGEYDVLATGVNQTRNVTRALGFIARLCPPAN